MIAPEFVSLFPFEKDLTLSRFIRRLSIVLFRIIVFSLIPVIVS